MGDSLSRLAKNLSEPLHLHRSRRTLARLHAQETGIEEWIDQALKFKGSRRIKTLQLRTEIRALCNLVAAIEPQRIAEIGTARGGTLLLWCQMATERVVSCDLRVRRFVERLAPSFPPPGGCRVEMVEGDTHSPQIRERLWRDIGRFGLDFLFIDGDHTAAGVEQDYRDYCGLVRPGGLIALHDIVEKQTLTTNQVGLFWRKLLGQADVTELVEDPGQSGYGIGVVRVPAEGASFPSSRSGRD